MNDRTREIGPLAASPGEAAGPAPREAPGPADEPPGDGPAGAGDIQRHPVPPDALDRLLTAHRAWLDSEGREGAAASLRFADLRGAQFEGAVLERVDFQGADLNGGNLQRADLRGADLRYADLSDCALRAADLSGANLRKANVRGANLRRSKLRGVNLRRVQGLNEAELQDSDMTDASGLLGDEFAGLDITGATLPRDIGAFQGLTQAQEIAKQARGLYLAVIGGCVYSWLTIATTTDAALVVNSAATPLPIIQTKVPIAGFYWAAPAILLSLYLYLNLYLQGLWESLARLPAVFPDGHSLDQRVHPWMVTSLVRAHTPLLQEERPTFSRLKVAVSIATTWMLVPLTLLLFWLRYLPRHEMLVSQLQFAAVLLSVGAGLLFYLRASATLRGRRHYSRGWRTSLGGSTSFASALAVLWIGLIGYAICDGAVNGVPRKQAAAAAPGLRTWVPQLVETTGYRTYADLTEATLSTRPQNWWRLEPDLQITLAGVAGAKLRGQDLRYAEARAAFLAKADLRNARLMGTVLTDADLRDANLLLADLRDAILLSADLEGALLLGADLASADLRKANLQRANLRNADLRDAALIGADLGGANLQRADLRGAVLSGADLDGARLTGALLLEAGGLTQAQLDGACGSARTRLPPGLTLRPCRRP